MSRDACNREAFEAYMLNGFCLQPELLQRDPETGEYDSIETQEFWLVWRSALAEAAARAGA